MTTQNQQLQQVYHHMESVGDIEYQRIGETPEAEQIVQDGGEEYTDIEEYGQHAYADCALNKLKAPSLAEDSYELQHLQQHSHISHLQQQQLLTTEEGDDDEADSSDCPNDSSHSNRQHAVDGQADMMMQPLYHGIAGGQSNPARTAPNNNGDLESIQSKQLLLNAAEQYDQPGQDSSVAAQSSELYKAHLAMQQAVNTQSSFEGYQTDLTNNSALTTAMKNSHQETYQTEGETSSVQQVAPVAPSIIEYTEVFVWGENKSGQLGIDSQLQPAPSATHGGIKVQYRRPDYILLPRSCSFNIVIKQLACGESHSGILTAQGHLYMMGSNSVGQLGVSTVGTVATSGTGLSQTQIEQVCSTGSPILVESLKALSVEQVSCGRDFTAVICRAAPPQSQFQTSGQVAKAEVYIWGSNLNGQLGSSHVQQSNLPVRLEAFDVLQEEIIQLSCGDSHSLFLTGEHDVISCGNNSQGQCGFDPQECAETSTPFKVAAFDGVQIVQVSAGYEHSLFLSSDGQVFASGSNQDLCIGAGDNFDRTQTPVHIEALANQRVVKVAANFSSSCITEQGEMYLWGRGVWGETAYPQPMLTISNPVVDVTLGLEVSVAIDNQGLAWSWGKNSHGELGVGDSQQRIHPFPLLNLKGKSVTKALCGHNFVICLGSNIKKDLNLGQTLHQTANMAPLDPKKKKVSKRKKNPVEARKKSSNRPHTSTTYNKYVNEHNQLVPAVQRKSRQSAAAEVRQQHQTFGTTQNGSRSSSADRSTSVGGQVARRQSRNVSQRNVTSQERTLANLQQKYGASHSVQQAMQITSMTSHEKSRLTNENTGPRSPIQAARNRNSKPLVTDYEPGKAGIEVDIVKSVKTLQNKVKNLKDENRAIKQELSSKNNTIEKLEKTVLKLQNDDAHQKQVLELTNDIKRNEMKLRKMKERRNHYRSEKDALKVKVEEMQTDNSALFQQVAQMQDSSHSTREENAKLKSKLSKTEQELEFVHTDYKAMKKQQESLREKNSRAEQELAGKLRWNEAKTNELENQLKFESDERTKMAKEITRLERLVASREDYVVSLENEAVMLRKEIKESKFNNEKQGYDRFVGGLTKLRSSQERPKSNNRGDLSGVSAERQTAHISLANQSTLMCPVKQERGYDDQLPQKEFSLGRKTLDYSRYQDPQMKLSSHSKGARSRITQADEPHRYTENNLTTGSAFPTMRSLQKANVISPRDQNSTQQKRTPIQVYRDNEELMRSSYQKQTTVNRNLIPSELPQTEHLNPRKNRHSSERKTTYHEEPFVNDKSLAETVLAVVPLEDMKVSLESQPEQSIDANTLEIESQQRHAEADVVSQLPDNSMVLMQQYSEQPTKPTNDEILAELQNPIATTASDFKDQHRVAASPEKEFAVRQQTVSESRPEVSTMIPLGAPKADNDLQEKYKAMLKAKFDMKTIHRRRVDKSREP